MRAEFLAFIATTSLCSLLLQGCSTTTDKVQDIIHKEKNGIDFTVCQFPGHLLCSVAKNGNEIGTLALSDVGLTVILSNLPEPATNQQTRVSVGLDYNKPNAQVFMCYVTTDQKYRTTVFYETNGLPHIRMQNTLIPDSPLSVSSRVEKVREVVFEPLQLRNDQPLRSDTTETAEEDFCAIDESVNLR